MARAHDIGGVKGLGPVEIEQDEPVFHSEWERRVFGMTMATLGKGLYGVEKFRSGVEQIPVVPYMESSYYERWIATLEHNLISGGVVTEDEIDQRTAELSRHPETEIGRREEPEFCEMLLGAIHGGMSPERELNTERRFAVGDGVVAVGTGAPGHTRLPRYVRGKQGTIARLDNAFVYPETAALDEGENPEWCYCVRFEASEVWGADAEQGAPVYVDVWESYLEPA
ncbi:MAG: nitrile hydratase subunit beta [Gaiellaceae bacterium]